MALHAAHDWEQDLCMPTLISHCAVLSLEVHLSLDGPAPSRDG